MAKKQIKLKLFLFLIFSTSVFSTPHLFFVYPKKNWPSFFEKLKTVFKLDTFIESGTYRGDTAAIAAQHFSKVHTIELVDEFYKQAAIRFSENKNVSVHHGNSIVILPSLLESLQKTSAIPLFWLDGHYMANMGVAEDDLLFINNHTPILKELAAIKDSTFIKCVILIDDVRLFGSLLHGKRIKKAGNDHYPILKTICDFLHTANFTYFIMGDILVAHNFKTPVSISPLLQAITVSRLFDETNYSIEEVLLSEALIAQAEGEEAVALITTYEYLAKPWKTAYDANSPKIDSWQNKSPHYNLWFGLIQQRQENHAEAIKQFKEAICLEYDHWRVFWYLAKSLYANHEIASAKEALEIVLTQAPDFIPALSLLNFIDK